MLVLTKGVPGLPATSITVPRSFVRWGLAVAKLKFTMIFDRNLNLNLASMLMSTVATFLLIPSWLAVAHSSLHDLGQGSHVEIKVDGIKVLVDPCSLETRLGGTASEVMCDVEVTKTD